MVESDVTNTDIEESQVGFWRRYLVTGVASFVVGAGALWVYALLTPHGPHRRPFEITAIVAIAVWVVIILPLGYVLVASKWRMPFFFLWGLSTIALLATAIGLDGGEKSPLAILLVLPVLFGWLAYPAYLVGSLALVTEGAYLGIDAYSKMSFKAKDLIVALVIALAGFIATAGAFSRAREERERRHLVDQLREQATRDSLTGCMNHRSFGARLKAEEERSMRNGLPFSVVMVDLDSFKMVNDTFGHDQGDATLVGVARVLVGNARRIDEVGRLGGDEFGILLPETGSDQALELVKRLQMALQAASDELLVTSSFGVATFNGQDDSASDVLRRADRALYWAKQAGRDRYVAWESIAQRQ